MRLAEVYIENFRSFERETIAFDNYTCFVGPNGSGKSTVLTALNVFFRNNTLPSIDINNLTAEDFHHRNTGSPIKIRLTFTNLNTAAQEDFKHYLRQQKLIVQAEAVWNQKTEAATVKQYGFRLVMQEFTKFFEALDQKAKVGQLKEIFTEIKALFPDLTAASTKDEMIEALRSYEEKHPEMCRLHPDSNEFYGWSKGANKLAKYIQWVYVPAVKDASSEQQESGKTALGQLLDRTIRAKIDFDNPLAKMKEEAKAKYNALIDRERGILIELENSLANKLRTWSPGANLQLNWHYDDDKSIVINPPAARVSIGEGEFIGEIARLGHGLQRSFLVSILNELAETDQENRPTLLLGIEEPELYQHPPQARHVSTVLQQMALESKKNSQVIITTHSPYFVSCENFPNIRMVRKHQNRYSRTYSTTYEQLEGIVSQSLGEAGSIESFIARLGPILCPSQNELFFSSVPILVEGPEDVAYIATQLELEGSLYKFKKLGCHFIIADGKNKMSRLLAIAIELKMPVYTVFDRDRSKPAQDNLRDNACILKLCKYKGTIDNDTIWAQNLTAWPENIGNTVADDFGSAEWSSACNTVQIKRNLQNVKLKNALMIGYVLKEFSLSKKYSTSLSKLCTNILTYAEEVNSATE